MEVHGQPLLALEVTGLRAEARDVMLVELRAPDRGPLPAFEPGAHLALELPGGLLRQYSLTNDWRERDRYVLGVGLAPSSRGGSEYVHQSLRRGTTVRAHAPRNGFALDPAASRFLFVAGGIGITPITAMIRWCAARGRPWRLVYAVRSAQRAAFVDTLAGFGGSVHLHCDDAHGRVLDPAPWLAEMDQGEHLYCCGPPPMMDAVRSAYGERLGTRAHFEYFSAPGSNVSGNPAPGSQAPGSPAPENLAREDPVPARADGGFTVELRRSGRSLFVPPDRSILETLEAAGMRLPHSCREGLCRTCETRVCEGAIEHRDYALSQDERTSGNTMLICVSRARGEHLVLDL